MNGSSLLFVLAKGLEQFADQGRRQFPGRASLLFSGPPRDIDAQDAETSAEIRHPEGGQAGEAVDARLVTYPQRMQEGQGESRTLEE
jgi:hypothetical protein